MRILFVSHAANRSGAPLVLLDLLRFIRRETQIEASILSARRGPLESEFALYAVPFPHARPFQTATLLGAAKRRVGEGELPRREQIERVINSAIRIQRRFAQGAARSAPRFDLVYANSAASGEAVRALEPVLRRGAKLVVHVHELAGALGQSRVGWAFLRERGASFIAASDAVRDELIRGQGIAPESVKTIYEWTDFARLATDREAARRDLHARIGAPENAVIVGGCGMMEARKGADWWIQSAFHALAVEPNARKSPAPLHFVWLGGGGNAFARDVKRDANSYGLEGRVHFLPPTDEPKTFFAGIDIFCLSSREDPFPLVAVEAAAQGVPLACFQNAGGTPELVGHDAGVVVPWGDTSAMGRALASLGRDESFRAQLGRNASLRARQWCDVEQQAPRVVEILKRVVAR